MLDETQTNPTDRVKEVSSYLWNEFRATVVILFSLIALFFLSVIFGSIFLAASKDTPIRWDEFQDVVKNWKNSYSSTYTSDFPYTSLTTIYAPANSEFTWKYMFRTVPTSFEEVWAHTTNMLVGYYDKFDPSIISTVTLMSKDSSVSQQFSFNPFLSILEEGLTEQNCTAERGIYNKGVCEFRFATQTLCVKLHDNFTLDHTGGGYGCGFSQGLVQSPRVRKHVGVWYPAIYMHYFEGVNPDHVVEVRSKHDPFIFIAKVTGGSMEYVVRTNGMVVPGVLFFISAAVSVMGMVLAGLVILYLHRQRKDYKGLVETQE